ncbi:MAG TPA: hypothetical protein VF698_13320 [Thermoanaerobaculia bacterium]
MRVRLLLIALVLVACRKEVPIAKTAAPPATATTAPAAPAPKPQSEHTYRGAGEWFNSTHGFRFTMKGAGFDVAGAMLRTTPGAERVRFDAGGRQYQGVAERTGVVWYTRAGGGTWAKGTPPPYADQVYQRATIFIDPAKVEGEAQRTGSGFRFTDTNGGDRHELTLDPAGRITKISVSGARPFTMTITQHDEMVNIDAPPE